MFHHFYGDNHIYGDGAISAGDLEMIISKIGRSNILSAQEWLFKWETNRLKNNEICLTFDDNLKSQYDIAYPVLKKHGITAFWYIYTSVYEGILEKIEIYRYFRITCFKKANDFYNEFFEMAILFDEKLGEAIKGFPEDYYIQYTFYSRMDRLFRYIRDVVLSPEKYSNIMELLQTKHNFIGSELRDKLWITKDEIKHLHAEGNIIGLHSHTHPTNISIFKFADQKKEYYTNYEYLTSIISEKPKTVAYPCGSYNDDTLKIMKDLNIKLGFRKDHFKNELASLEYPRFDHAYILNN